MSTIQEAEDRVATATLAMKRATLELIEANLALKAAQENPAA